MKRSASVVRAEVYNDFERLSVTGMLARFWWVGCHSPCTGILRREEQRGAVGNAAPLEMRS
jgi:hypothetical protein